MKNETDKWITHITDEGDCYILPPGVAPDDMHSYYIGDMESADGCCFKQAEYVVRACNGYEGLLETCKGLIEDLDHAFPKGSRELESLEPTFAAVRNAIIQAGREQ